MLEAVNAIAVPAAALQPAQRARGKPDRYAGHHPAAAGPGADRGAPRCTRWLAANRAPCTRRGRRSVPLGEDVGIKNSEVAGVRGDGGCALTPDPRLPRRERRVRDLDAGGFGPGAVEVAPRGGRAGFRQDPGPSRLPRCSPARAYRTTAARRSTVTGRPIRSDPGWRRVDGYQSLPVVYPRTNICSERSSKMTDEQRRKRAGGL